MITYTSPKFVEIFKSLISFRPIFYSFDNSADSAMSFDTKYEHQRFALQVSSPTAPLWANEQLQP
jgi:hypothetical protein